MTLVLCILLFEILSIIPYPLYTQPKETKIDLEKIVLIIISIYTLE